MSKAEHESESMLTKDTQYLALVAELWDVFCGDLGENWPLWQHGTVPNRWQSITRISG